MAVLMTAHGRFSKRFSPVVGRISTTAEGVSPSDTVLICRQGQLPTRFDGLAAVLIEGSGDPPSGRCGVFGDLGHLEAGDLVLVDGIAGVVRTLYRKASPHNALFVTERCNSNCIMCSQPPKAEAEDRLRVCLRVVELLREAPPSRLGITGGEPTLLGNDFVRLVGAMKKNLPETTITALTNGRRFADSKFVAEVACIGHSNIRFTIPLHADVADIHDYIAQAKGSFWETVAGFYNLAAHDIELEIRVVLHALSVPRLPALAEFVCRKLPFARQVVFMGMENMGYVKKNWECLWIDPIDYAIALRKSVLYLHRRGIEASIYNLPYCVLPEDLWGFARQSISDHKQLLIQECEGCDLAPECAGFFASGRERHSRGIRPHVRAHKMVVNSPAT